MYYNDHLKTNNSAMCAINRHLRIHELWSWSSA